VVFLIRGVHFVVAFDESIGVKYALGSVEIEAATPHSIVTFFNAPLELGVLIIRHYRLAHLIREKRIRQ